MRRVLGLTIGLLARAGPVAAQTYTLGQPLTAVWNGTANEAAEGVDSYQVRVDAGAYTPSGQTVPRAEYRYAIPQALLTIGAHTIAIRACAGTSCGPEASVSVTIQRPAPGLPQNPRVVPTPGLVLSLPRAQALAQAYAWLALERSLTTAELNWLAVQHGPQPPTRESVFRVLDAAYAGLVGAPQE